MACYATKDNLPEKLEPANNCFDGRGGKGSKDIYEIVKMGKSGEKSKAKIEIHI